MELRDSVVSVAVALKELATLPSVEGSHERVAGATALEAVNTILNKIRDVAATIPDSSQIDDVKGLEQPAFPHGVHEVNEDWRELSSLRQRVRELEVAKQLLDPDVGFDIPVAGDAIPYVDSEIGTSGVSKLYMRDDTIAGLILFGSPGDADVDEDGDASLEFTVDGGSRYGLRVRRLETYYDNGSGQRLIPIWLDTYGLSIPIDIGSPGNVTVTGTNDGLSASVGIQDILVGANKGDLLFYDGDSWEYLPIGDDGQILSVDTDLPAWVDPSAGSAHNILSSTHTDSATASVARGDIITGQGATPAWTKLVISIPASGFMKYLGVGNADLEPGYQDLFDDGEGPVDTADVADPGDDLVVARRNHVHKLHDHHALHEEGGDQEISVAGLSGELADAQKPKAHDVLSTYHDAVAQAVAAGALIYGNATPKWDLLAKGTDGQVLTMVTGYPAWAAATLVGHKLLAHSDAVSGDPVAGDLIVANSTPNWTKLAKGTDGDVLKMVSGAPTWDALDLEDLLAGTTGDIIYHDGDGWVVLAAGDDGQFLSLDTGLPAWADVEQLPSGTKGDILYHNGTGWTKLTIGSDGQVLTVATDVPAWEAAGGGSSPFAVGHRLLAWRTDDHTINGYRWVYEDGRTIGDASSGATLAHADYEDLFKWLWDTAHYNPDTDPVVGGRGASAADDWTNHKKFTLPNMCKDSAGNANMVSPAGVASGSTPGKLQGAASHTHTGPGHQHLLGEHIFACGQHGHAVSYGSSGSGGAISFTHLDDGVYISEGEPNTDVLIPDSDHSQVAHVHGPGDYSTNDASVDASTDGTELTGESGTGNTGSTSSYHPVMSCGFFVLAWTP